MNFFLFFLLLLFLTGKRERGQGFITKLEGKLGDPTKIETCSHALLHEVIAWLSAPPRAGASPLGFPLILRILILS